MDVATIVLKEDSEVEDFKYFIGEIRKQCGTVHHHGFRILPDVDDKKVFTAKLKEGQGHGNLILIFGQKNVYFIAWETADRVVIFDDLQSVFKKSESKVQERRVDLMESGRKRNKKGQARNSSTPSGRDHPRLATANLAGLSCDYPSLCGLAAPRNKIVLGHHALRKAMKALSEPIVAREEKGYRDYIKYIANYVLVIILMIPECVRFNDMLDYVVDQYDTGACIDEYLVDLTNDWSKLSKEVLRYPIEFDDLSDNQKQVIRKLAVILRDAKQ